MQEKMQKISPLKQRILQYVDYLGISKREFYAQTGVSRGTLDNHTGLTEDTLAKIFATYKNISSEWLLRGIGEMLINNKEYPIPSNEPTDVVGEKKEEIYISVFHKLIDNKDNRIIELSIENDRLKHENEDLRKQIPQ